MMKHHHYKYILLLLFFTVISCDRGTSDPSVTGELIVLTRNAPTTWYEKQDEIVGFEHDLVMAFAEDNGYKVQFKVLDDINNILTTIKANGGHFAAAGITKTDERVKKGFFFGPEYQQVQQLVVCRRGNTMPRKKADLVDRTITVPSGTSYEETLISLKQENPELEWSVSSDVDTEQLLEQVWLNKIDCTIADSNIVSINRRYYPELIVAFPVSENEPLAWVLAPQWQQLSDDMDKWLEQMESSGRLAVIKERYYGQFEIYDYVDISRYKRRIDELLPGYIGYFKTAAEKYNLPWTLLAAQSYQESHWNPKARSPTGVRGMMMLTLNTAQAMGVDSRLDVEESIDGGARYLNKMLERIPESVAEKDRIWFALAAYNVGFGHLRDARVLAERLGRDPDRWISLKEVLPLLSSKKYYKTLRHGYARGTEPVRYVQRIREYRHVLEQHIN